MYTHSFHKYGSIVSQAQQNQWDNVEWILSRYSNNYSTGDRSEVLILAVTHGQQRIVDYLLNAKTLIDIMEAKLWECAAQWLKTHSWNPHYPTYVTQAIRHNQNEILALLLQREAYAINANPSRHNYYIEVAAKEKRWSMIVTILATIIPAPQKQIVDKSHYGDALLLSMEYLNEAASLAAADALLDAGANPATLERGQTPLHWAVHWKNNLLLEKMLRNGVALNTQNNEHKTAAQMAADQSNWPAIKSFMQHAPEQFKPNLEYVLVKAFAAKQTEMVKELLQLLNQRIAINHKPFGAEALTALHYAINSENAELINWLLEQGADTSVVADKQTPIEFAAAKNYQFNNFYLIYNYFVTYFQTTKVLKSDTIDFNDKDFRLQLEDFARLLAAIDGTGAIDDSYKPVPFFKTLTRKPTRYHALRDALSQLSNEQRLAFVTSFKDHLTELMLANTESLAAKMLQPAPAPIASAAAATAEVPPTKTLVTTGAPEDKDDTESVASKKGAESIQEKNDFDIILDYLTTTKDSQIQFDNFINLLKAIDEKTAGINVSVLTTISQTPGQKLTSLFKPSTAPYDQARARILKLSAAERLPLVKKLKTKLESTLENEPMIVQQIAVQFIKVIKQSEHSAPRLSTTWNHDDSDDVEKNPLKISNKNL